MKSTILFALISLLALWSCQKNEKAPSDDTLLTFTGTIWKLEAATTYQYGSHLLNTGDSTFALRSSTLDLNQYVLEPVTVTAKKIEGYPVEDGPVFLEVVSITR